MGTESGTSDPLAEIFAPAARERALDALTAQLTAGGDPALAARVGETLAHYAALLDIATTVAGEPDLDRLLPKLVDTIARTLGAERATLFLHDAVTDELYSRVARGGGVEEIRIAADSGIVGAAFRSGEVVLVADAYEDARFNREIDHATGFRTRNLLCAPLRARDGRIIGVTQVLNRRRGAFESADGALLAAMTAHAAIALESAQLVERLQRARREETRLFELMSAISTELDLTALLKRIVEGATALLGADRGTCFLHDGKTAELWSVAAEGAGQREIRIPADAGIAGWVFTHGEPVNLVDAYADPRFNRAVDVQTGYRTRSLLCLPVCDRLGQSMGVVQLLNKRSGPFTAHDESRLRAFCAQAVAALENAQLFDEVLRLKNYNEGILKSLTNGVVTLGANGDITKVNEAACRIFAESEAGLLGRPARQVFGNTNPWIVNSLDYVTRSGKTDFHPDTDLRRLNGGVSSVNLHATPLFDLEGNAIGAMLVLEDITREKRVRSTMARYMAKEVVDRLIEAGEEMLAATDQEATVLFSDIRRFTTLAEGLGIRGTADLLNEYFTDMVEVIFANGGILDKYIGDAIMAVFGAPISHGSDADNAVRVANEMMSALRRFNERRRQAGAKPIEIGIGASTGQVLAGSIGSVKRMEYTVIGDTVNLAARLETANKYYGTNVLVSANTVERLSDRSALREIDLLRARGFVRPTAIFESFAHYPIESRRAVERLLAPYREALAAYRERRWGEAIDGFRAALAIRPADRPSQIHLDRALYCRDHPPPEGWDCVWTIGEN